MVNCRFCQLAAVAVAAATPAVSRAVVFQIGPDPVANKVAPGGALTNSGWQYQFGWKGGFLGTPVAPHYFVSAGHIGGGVGDVLAYNGQTYTVTAVVGNFGDLRVFRVDNEFYSFAPRWDTGLHGSESGKEN